RCAAIVFLAISAPLCWGRCREGVTPEPARPDKATGSTITTNQDLNQMAALGVIIVCGLLSVAYGGWATTSVLNADAGSPKMQEISAAVREGAQAYLKRQYATIGMVGVVIFVLVGLLLGWLVAVGFAIGAVLSGSAGFIGMNVSVRAN